MNRRSFTASSLGTAAEAANPLFLYMPHTIPHVPLFAGERFKGRSARGLYGDVVEEMDWSVGEIRKQLEQSGVAGNTLILVTSDNGPWLYAGVREPPWTYSRPF